MFSALKAVALLTVNVDKPVTCVVIKLEDGLVVVLVFGISIMLVSIVASEQL